LPGEQPLVLLLDLGVLLAGLRERGADGGEVVFHPLLRGAPFGDEAPEGAGGTARPRALQLLELGVEGADLTLDAPDGLPGGRRVCEDGFAVYLECAHAATLGARRRGRGRRTRIRG